VEKNCQIQAHLVKDFLVDRAPEYLKLMNLIVEEEKIVNLDRSTAKVFLFVVDQEPPNGLLLHPAQRYLEHGMLVMMQ
jgi:hypothetical protein